MSHNQCYCDYKRAKSAKRFPQAVVPGFVLVLCLAVTQSADAITLPLMDDFGDGSATDGMPVAWLPLLNPTMSHSVNNGVYEMTGPSSLGVALVEDSGELRDVSVHTKIRLTETAPGADDFQYVGPILRSNAEASNFYWGGITSHGFLAVGHWLPFAESAAVSVPFDPTGAEVDLELRVVDQTLSLWAWSDEAGVSRPETPQITWNSSFAIEQGAVGLSYNPRGGAGTMSVSSFAAVPEPSTWLLLANAITCVAALGWRDRFRLR